MNVLRSQPVCEEAGPLHTGKQNCRHNLEIAKVHLFRLSILRQNRIRVTFLKPMCNMFVFYYEGNVDKPPNETEMKHLKFVWANWTRIFFRGHYIQIVHSCIKTLFYF